MGQAGKVLDALGNPMRRQIVEILRVEPSSVGELAARLPVSRPAVSKHLRLLEEAGLVAFHTEGTRNIFRLCTDGFAEAQTWISQFWDEALARFVMVAQSLPDDDLSEKAPPKAIVETAKKEDISRVSVQDHKLSTKLKREERS